MVAMKEQFEMIVSITIISHSSALAIVTASLALWVRLRVRSVFDC